VSVLVSENFLSKSLLSTLVAPRLKTKASSSSGQHCGEYRVVYHKNNGGRFFLIFEAKYPNPELKKGKAGCFAVGDFWEEIGGMGKTKALAPLGLVARFSGANKLST
jgi:hypothetical protein